MDREITVFGIVLPGKGALEFIRIDRFRDLIQFSVDFRGLRLGAFLLSDFDQGEKVMDTAIDTGMAVDFIFEAFGLTSDFLCFGGISPDIRLFEEGFEFGKALPFSGNVKDGLRVRSPVIRGFRHLLLFFKHAGLAPSRNYILQTPIINQQGGDDMRIGNLGKRCPRRQK
ncbi:MAG: hypothetical protein UZ16_OP3001000447 [Candidatus Hinthialibacteria bacterium OLB16]|nr:MAG: hypothetical protein UZ16_OP3001000447 [Candidatus Hinthialibacteria bacterium OLB16]